jgi:tetratricopeptide (TPR) repeat protein
MKDLAIDLRGVRDELTSSERPAIPERVALAKPSWAWVAAMLAAVVLAAVSFYLLGKRDVPPPAIGLSGRPAIAVMYFEDHTGAKEIRWLSTGLPSMLVTGLAQTPGLDVVSSQRIHEILKEVGEKNLESIDKSLVDEVARRAGAGAVVVGSIFKSGNEIRIDVQVEDVGSGRILSAESVRGEDVFPLVDELTGRIRSSLALGDRPPARSIVDVTTSSLEAYQLYSEGLDSYRNLRYVDARTRFEKAIEIDPSFAMAYFWLSRVFRALGETAISEDYLRKVLENLERLPDRHRLVVQAQHARHTEGDLDKALGLYERLVASYPDEEDGYFQMARIYSMYMNERAKALAVLERGVKALPRSPHLRNDLGYELLQAGRYPEAIREFEIYAELAPNEPNPHDSLAEAYLVTGQPEKALERYRRSLDEDPSFFASYIGRAWAYGMLGRYEDVFSETAKIKEILLRNDLSLTISHFMDAFVLSRLGRYREAQDHLDEGIDLARDRQDGTMECALELLAAWVAIERERYSEALARVEELGDLLPEMPVPSSAQIFVHLLAGVAEARRGNLAAARQRLDAQKQLLTSPSSATDIWWHHALEAEIALSEGDWSAAETAFSAGEPELKMNFSISVIPLTVFTNNLPFHDGRARALKAKGDVARAIEIYGRLLTPDIGNKWTAMLEPRYVLELARLLDQNGDKEGARREYQRFLDLWKDADRDLAEVDEARAYLAGDADPI